MILYSSLSFAFYKWMTSESLTVKATWVKVG